MLGALGLDVSNVVSSTDVSTIWSNIVTTFINPLGAIEQSAVSGLSTLATDATNAWDSLFGGAPASSSTPITGAVAASALPNITIGGVVNSIEGHIQSAVDAIVNTLGVATGSGNAIAKSSVSLAQFRRQTWSVSRLRA